MGRNFAGGLLAGVTAAVIWISICLMVDMPSETTGLWVLIFLIVVTAATIIISKQISKNKKAQRS